MRSSCDSNSATRIIPLDVSEEEKHCESCGGEKTKIGEDERRVLQYQPAVLEVEVYVLPKYACPCCRDGVVCPPPPERIFPRSIAGLGWGNTPSFLSCQNF